jgi:hypothetical protein
VVEAEAGAGAGAGAARQMKRPREAAETPRARRGAEQGAGAGRPRPGTGRGARMERREEDAVAMRGGGALEDCGPPGSFCRAVLSLHQHWHDSWGKHVAGAHLASRWSGLSADGCGVTDTSFIICYSGFSCIRANCATKSRQSV